jgi:hypothetical protein
LFGVNVIWSEHVDPAQFVTPARVAQVKMTDVTTLGLVGKSASNVVERFRYAAVRAGAQYLSSFGLGFDLGDVDELAQGRVGVDLLRCCLTSTR